MDKVYVLHYAGRGTPEANEVEEVFASMDALMESVMSDYSEKTREEVEEMLDEGEHLYYREYKVTK